MDLEVNIIMDGSYQSKNAYFSKCNTKLHLSTKLHCCCRREALTILRTPAGMFSLAFFGTGPANTSILLGHPAEYI